MRPLCPTTPDGVAESGLAAGCFPGLEREGRSWRCKSLRPQHLISQLLLLYSKALHAFFSSVCGQKNQEYTKQCVKQLFKSSFLFLLIILKSKVPFKSSLLSHSLPCCLPPCCCSSAPHLPPAPSRPLSARSGNKARHRVSSRNSGSGGGCLPTDSETCCAYQRGEYFYQQANSSDRNFSLHSC